jgi:UDP-N-acetylglucosamine:LPS N-acetylglucosamine transferase
VVKTAPLRPIEPDNPRVELIYFDAGGGHRASAAALAEVLADQRPAWQVETVDLRSVLEPIDIIRRATGIRVEDFYNNILKSNLTVGIGAMLKVMHMLIRQLHPKMVPLLARHWQRYRPDLVVSLIPHFNRAMFDGLRAANITESARAPSMVTVMTDFADYPPNFWIERQNQFLICGTAAAARQARVIGIGSERILRTSGMIVRPEFYKAVDVCREAERQRLGLEPTLPTGLVMFGGFGSRRIETIVKRVASSGLKTQLILLCGHNQQLRDRLNALRLPFPCRIEGFTSEIPYFMRLADFFIGKPGPGSISEAMVMGLPVIVERSVLTMVHERYNTDWLLQNQVGVVLHSFAEIEKGLEIMLDPERMTRFHTRIRSMENRAVFEIPDMLDAIIAARDGEPGVLGQLRA